MAAEGQEAGETYSDCGALDLSSNSSAKGHTTEEEDEGDGGMVSRGKRKMENWCAEEGRRKWARWEDEVRRKSKEERREEKKEEERRRRRDEEKEEKKEEERRGERARVNNKRKNIKMVMREERLGSVTKTARAEEEERLARLGRLQQEEIPSVADEEEHRKENKDDDQRKENKVHMISSSESDDCKIVQDDHRKPMLQD